MSRMALVLGALVLVSCATASAPVTTTTVTTAASTVASPPPVPQVLEPRGCTNVESPPWSLLCQAYRLIEANHIDRPDAASLAAAAAAGVRSIPASGGGGDGSSGEECVIPHPGFVSVCEVVADRLAEHTITDLVDGAVRGMFRYGLDPYSAYLGPDDAAGSAFGAGHVLSLGLVVAARDADGAGCGPLSETCELQVLAVMSFSSAERQTVLVGDVVTAIEGTPVAGLSEAEAVAALHAEPGTETTITVSRDTGTFLKRLVHEDVRPASVEYGMLTPDIAYLRMNDFSQQAAQAVGQVLQRSDVAAASGMILDLRDNPGGLVLSAQAVASQFLTEGTVLVEETRAGNLSIEVIPGGLARTDLDIVVIVNGGTASAAEVVAAALRAQGRALVVGQPTFGKNLVQEVFVAPNDGEFRISVARWYAADGTDVGRGGLQPDRLIDLGRDASVILAEVSALLGG